MDPVDHIHTQLELFRGMVERGRENARINNDGKDGRQLLESIAQALRICQSSGRPLPEWLFLAVYEPIVATLDYDHGSLDQAFLHRPVTELRTKQRRAKSHLQMAAWLEYSRRRREGEEIQWPELAKLFGSNETTLQELVYEIEELTKFD